MNYSTVYQFQKQGKDMERVKQRLAEIANYVDKVSTAWDFGGKTHTSGKK